MNSTIRRTIGSLAAVAAAGTGALVTAPAARADVETCLAQLAGPAASTHRLIV